jgi:hypothetical protein
MRLVIGAFVRLARPALLPERAPPIKDDAASCNAEHDGQPARPCRLSGGFPAPVTLIGADSGDAGEAGLRHPIRRHGNFAGFAPLALLIAPI